LPSWYLENTDDDEDSFKAIEIYENQRYQPFLGWGSSKPGHLLPTDRRQWSDEKANMRGGKLNSKTRPAVVERNGWVVFEDTSRKIDEGGTGKGGWVYGVDWSTLHKIHSRRKGM
jgi:hypothetical protein